jgi:tetratricopeptide (TPR) repeat protein
MMRKRISREKADTLSNFVQGRALFESYLETGNPDELSEASECFGSAVVSDAKFDLAVLYQAVCQTELGNTDAAIADLQALAKKPEFALDAQVQLAHAYARAGNYPEARRSIEEAMTKLPTTSKRYLVEAYHASLLAAGGQPLEALDRARRTQENLDQALQNRTVRPDDQSVRAARFEVKMAEAAALMRQQPSSKDAERVLLAARALRPNSARALFMLARVHISRGDLDGGTRSYETARDIVARALEITPFDEVLVQTSALLRNKTEGPPEPSSLDMTGEAAAWFKRSREKKVGSALADLAKLKGVRSPLLADLPPESSPETR